MHEISDKNYGEMCDLLSGASGLMQLLLFEKLTDKQRKYADEVAKALIRMRILINGHITKKQSQTSGSG